MKSREQKRAFVILRAPAVETNAPEAPSTKIQIPNKHQA
jgi:hypothetical protein